MKIVMDPHIINDCGLGAAIFKAAEELKVPCVTEELGLPFTISWKRTVTDWVETGFEVCFPVLSYCGHFLASCKNKAYKKKLCFR